MAEFNGYPGMIPGTSLVDWESGEPNARYRALKLLVDHVHVGDAIVPTSTGYPGFPDARVHAQAFAAPNGSHAIVLVNKRGVPMDVEIGEWSGEALLRSVNADSGNAEPIEQRVSGGKLTLQPYATAVLSRG